ncbi:MAG: hypothetical protein ABWW69_06115 [Pyrodictiaceae archaeon]
MSSPKPAIILGVVLFAVILTIGYTAISSSRYMDVSSLKSYKNEVHVIVSGKPVVMGIGKFYMKVNNTIFIVDAHGVYGVAKRVKGPLLGSDDSYAVFLLQGKDGSVIAALYSASEFKARYGMKVDVSDKVVVEGIYKPSLRTELYTPSGDMVTSTTTIVVSKILEGCHKSYKQPIGTVSG